MKTFMTHDQLIQSLTQIKFPSDATIAAYQNVSSLMELALNEQFKSMDNLDAIIGEGNFNMMISNHQNHSEFMNSVFNEFDPEVFIQTLYWVFRTYVAHGFQPIYWEYQLNGWLDVMRRHLTTDQFDELAPVYQWILEHLEQLIAAATPSHID